MSVSYHAKQLQVVIAYNRSYMFGLAIIVSLLFGTDCIFAANESHRAPVTVSDRGVDVEELKLMLKPLTRDELLVEAGAWQALLRDKVEEIAAMEIAAVRRLRMEEEAREKVESGSPAEAAGDDALKVSLLEQANALRDERTALIDRLSTVLDAIEAKTDPSDSETTKQVQEFRLYTAAVSGLEVNVKDTTSAWIAIRGWVTSDEGGKRWAMNFAEFFGILAAA
jgi:small conductance mechanosensitive channel